MATMESKPYYYQYRFIRESCQNPRHPSYHLYGALGITSPWTRGEYHEFYDWLIHTLGERPGTGREWILGRKNKTGNWEPNNMEWQTIKVRSQTKARQNVYATYRRRRQALTKWAEDLGIPYHNLRRRYAEGWTIAEIVKEYT